MKKVDELLRNVHPEIRDFALALHCYKQFKEHGAKSLNEIAKKVETDHGIKKHTLYRAIEEFQTIIGQLRGYDKSQAVAFIRIEGKRDFRLAEGVEELFAKIEDMLDAYQQLLHPDHLTIRIGTGLSVRSHLLPTVLRSFRETEHAQPVNIDTEHGMPQQIREKGREGKLDLVLTSCPEDIGDLEKDVQIGVFLNMYVICPSGHTLVENFQWERLADMTVVLLTEDRSPAPTYPLERIPPNARVVNVESYPQAHHMVLAGGNTVCFSFPQILSPEEKRYLDAVKVEELGAMRLCLIWPQSAKKRRTPAEQKVIQTLVDAFVSHLQQIETCYLTDEITRLSRKRCLYHVGHVGADRSKLTWLRGEINLRFTEDGLIKGKHEVKAPPGEQTIASITYSVFGNITKNNGRCHLAWTGSTREGHIAEEYAATFVCDESELITRNSALVGVWTGRQTWTHEPGYFAPSLGYMIMTDESIDDNERLASLVMEYETKKGPLRLAVPG